MPGKGSAHKKPIGATLPEHRKNTPTQYVKIKVSDILGEDFNKRWVYEHRQVAEQMLGRPLDTREHVHHLNHDRSDNRVENLVVITSAEHRQLHPPPKKWTREELIAEMQRMAELLPSLGFHAWRLSRLQRISADVYQDYFGSWDKARHAAGFSIPRTKTHCIRGHEMSGDNLWFSPTDGRRQCRLCNKIRRSSSHSQAQSLDICVL